MLISFRWPLAGGILIVAVGIFALFMFGGGVALIGLLVLLIGLAFIADGFFKRRSIPQEVNEFTPWWRRHLRLLLAIGLPVLVFVSVSVNMLPIVSSRQDDGIRDARLIEGQGVSLIWAPEGPGWNWQQPWGGYPSWQSVALYGVPPIGMDDKPGYGKIEDERVYATAEDMAATNLCRYLSEDGLTLMDTPQNIWRMPTTDELVQSLGRHGENAGCEWGGEVPQQADCDTIPDKESPLWAADLAPIYYWSAESYSEREGYFVAYNGMVNAATKTGGNPRHSYRCVREK